MINQLFISSASAFVAEPSYRKVSVDVAEGADPGDPPRT
jgi:hypothetical protein